MVADSKIASFKIADRPVGPAHSCFIIAEAGVNHNGSLEMARQLVDAAVQTGADAVKFQTFQAEQLVTPQAAKAEYQLSTTDADESQFEMLRRLELSPEAHLELMDHCRTKGILFMSSAFDEESADLLAQLGVALFKIPSGELTNLQLLAHIARYGKPMIVSTGMAYLSEVEEAVRCIQGCGNDEFALLHCVSNYPAQASDINLKAMTTMSAAFGVPVGYSDHTQGIEIAVAAVSLGACVIEKHLTLDQNLPGPDHKASLPPDQFGEMVQAIRSVELALGDGRKIPSQSEAAVAAVARKSLVAAHDIPAGGELTEEMVAVKRPGTGLPPGLLPHLLGRTARRPIPAGALITLDMVL